MLGQFADLALLGPPLPAGSGLTEVAAAVRGSAAADVLSRCRRFAVRADTGKKWISSSSTTSSVICLP